jgi:hypothetical protein
MKSDIEKIFCGENHLYGRIDIDNFSVSGCGSQMDNSTESIRKNLYNFLKNHNIKNIADIPCGDFWWMRHVDLGDINYIGGDIITQQIDKLKKNFPDNAFERIDIRIDKLPAVDLLFCRDCLFHLSDIDKKLAFDNFINSDIEYILMSNHPQSNNNLDISTGDFTHINWQMDPWNFGPPVDILYDSNTGYDTKEMQLYTKNQIIDFIK